MYWQFDGEPQQAQAMQALLARSGNAFASEAVYAEDKPTARFWSLLDSLGALSHGESIVARIALDIWKPGAT
jgi:hypothetical protein